MGWGDGGGKGIDISQHCKCRSVLKLCPGIFSHDEVLMRTNSNNKRKLST